MVQTQRILVFGDSITANSNLLVADRPRLWLNQLKGMSKGHLEMINEGKSGRPTDSLTEFQTMLKQQSRPDLLVIALGANDARDITPDCVPKAVANEAWMIDAARAKYGEALPILLVGPTNIRRDSLGPTKPIGAQREAKVKELGFAFEELAEQQKCSFVSLYNVVPDGSLTHDGVHPDADGNDAIAQVMLPAIERALRSTTNTSNG